MLVAAAVCPHPPLLVPEVASGAAHELEDLRAACDRAVGDLVAAEPTTVAVLGAADHARELEGRGGSLRGYGVPLDVGTPPRTLPLAHTVGCWLLDRSGYAGARAFLGLTGASPPRVPDTPRVALLVMGDGSARGSEKAPGYLDERAASFDAAVADALARGPDALARIDGRLGAQLLAAGVPAWHALAALARGQRWACEVTFAAAPYGVGYVVASWRAR